MHAARTPSKQLSISFLEELQTNHLLSPSGKEYSACEVDDLLQRKRQAKADADTDSLIHSFIHNAWLDQAESRPDMSVSIKTLELDQDPVMAMPGVDAMEARNIARAEAKQIAFTMINEAVERQTRMLDAELSSTRADLKQLINDNARAKKSIMHVQLNDAPVVDLGERVPSFFPELLGLAKARENILLVGPAGCGKTFAAQLLAKALKLPFYTTTLTAGITESALMARQTKDGFIEMPFKKAARNGGVMCLDEIDCGDPNVLALANQTLANRRLSDPFTGEEFDTHKDFIFIGNANTTGKGADMVYTARNRLDAATLDRLWYVEADYDEELEKELCPDEGLLKSLHEARRILREKKSKEFISTRKIAGIYKLKAMGLDEGTLFRSLTFAWPKDLVTQSGLVCF